MASSGAVVKVDRGYTEIPRQEHSDQQQCGSTHSLGTTGVVLWVHMYYMCRTRGVEMLPGPHIDGMINAAFLFL